MSYEPHVLVLDIPIHFASGPRGRKHLRTGLKPPPVAKDGLVPRVSRLMALAWRLDGLIQRGKAKDFAQLAVLCHVSRARISQVMNLLNLAPDLQETILFLPLTQGERETVPEREVRAIALEPDWGRQRERWKALCEGHSSIAPESREVTKGSHAQTTAIEASFRVSQGKKARKKAHSSRTHLEEAGGEAVASRTRDNRREEHASEV